MLDQKRLGEMLIQNQAMTIHVLTTRQHPENLEVESFQRLQKDERFANGVAQSVGGINKIVNQNYSSERGVDQKAMAAQLTVQQSLLLHAATQNTMDAENEMDVVNAAGRRYDTEPAFRDMVASSVGALMDIVFTCDDRPNLVEVPKDD